MNKVVVKKMSYTDILTGETHYETIRIAYISNEYLLSFCESFPFGFFTSVCSKWELPIGEKKTCEESGLTYTRKF